MTKSCSHYLLFHPPDPYAVWEGLIWKKKFSNVTRFGNISTVLYLSEKEILGPFSATNLDLCLKCFITIYRNDSVDIFIVLWCHKLKTLLYLCSHISPKLTSVVSYTTDWDYGETLQIAIWTQSMNNFSSFPCLTPSALLFTDLHILPTHSYVGLKNPTLTY